MYEKFFRAEDPFWRGMGRLFDIVEAGVLWLICSLPLFTAGPASAALCSTMIRLLREEETSVHRDFFHAFRERFRRDVGAGALLYGAEAFLWIDVRTAHAAGTGLYTFLMVFFFVLFLVWSATLLYAFPLLALREGGLGEVLILAFSCAIRYLPRTLLLVLMAAVCLWICHLAPLFVPAVVGIAVHTGCALTLPALAPWLPGPDDRDT